MEMTKWRSVPLISERSMVRTPTPGSTFYPELEGGVLLKVPGETLGKGYSNNCSKERKRNHDRITMMDRNGPQIRLLLPSDAVSALSLAFTPTSLAPPSSCILFKFLSCLCRLVGKSVINLKKIRLFVKLRIQYDYLIISYFWS